MPPSPLAPSHVPLPHIAHLMRAMLISSMAKRYPMHMRGPMPKGR
jgi:hypothetical protein